MEGVEAKIGNARQAIYDNITPENIYYSASGDADDVDDPPFPYRM